MILPPPRLGDLPVKHVARFLIYELIARRSKGNHGAIGDGARSGDSVPTPDAAMDAVEPGPSLDRTTKSSRAEQVRGLILSRRPAPGASAWSAPRLPGESARDHRAFCIYRDLGPRRSLQKAWREYCTSVRPVRSKLRGRPRRSSDVITKCPGAWTSLCAKYHWVQRAEAYDLACDERWLAAGEELIGCRDR
jgi:hypothetical protein